MHKMCIVLVNLWVESCQSVLMALESVVSLVPSGLESEVSLVPSGLESVVSLVSGLESEVSLVPSGWNVIICTKYVVLVNLRVESCQSVTASTGAIWSEVCGIIGAVWSEV